MRTLAIDCATDACSVALFEDDILLAGEYALLGRGHAEALLPMIARLPDRGRAKRIVVDLGPGSFTGIRIGLAAARALALAWGGEALGYPAPALVAAMARDAWGPVPVTVVNNGGHGEWFVQRFEADGMALDEVRSLPADEAVKIDHGAHVVGSKAAEAAHTGAQVLDLRPDARAFSLLPPAFLTADLRPLYGRAPDAKLPG